MAPAKYLPCQDRRSQRGTAGIDNKNIIIIFD
jgi:hypothetical protein